VRRLIAVLSWFVLTASLASCGSGGGPEEAPPPPGSLPADFARHAGLLDLAEGDVPGLEIGDRATTLHGPHFMYPVAGRAVVTGELPPTLVRELDLDAGAKPAPGHELVVVRAAERWFIPARIEDSGGRPEKVELVAGDATRPSPLDHTLFEGTLVFSVPAGGRAALRVTDEGRTQTLDLRKLEQEDVVEGYYPIRSGGFSETQDTDNSVFVRVSGRGVSAIPAGKRFVGLHVDDVEATLQPWFAGRGWAPDGKAWLVVDLELTASPVQGVNETILWNLEADSFRLTGPDGKRIAAKGEPVRTDVLRTGYGRLTAAVPSGLTSVTLSFAPVGTAKTDRTIDWTPHLGAPQRLKVKLR
jgi:hypothetical protein